MNKLTSHLALALMAMLTPLLCWAQYEGTHYLMHSSGLHLAKGASSAILEAPSASEPQMMSITPTADGYYNISASDGTFLAKHGANQWNTGFVADGSVNEAKFSIEKSGTMLKLKCKANNKYLGVDNVTAGSSVYCDKNGSATEHLWYLAETVDGEVPVALVDVIVNPAATRQQFEGFGVSLCWWAHMCGQWPEEDIDRIVDWLVSPENLNYRVFRYNIGGGDDPENRHCDPHHMAKGKGIRAEIPGYKPYEDSEYDWDADAAQVKIMLKIKEKRPDAVFEAFSNSAPWWMTYSGCCSGSENGSSDNLKPEYYEAFCHYLVDVCKHIKDAYGIEFRTLEPFNEPMSTWWKSNGGQEGCHFSVNAQADLIKVLYPILRDSGLNTVISVSDENDISQQVKDFTAFENAGILDYIGQVNAHTYNGNVNACSNMVAQCRDAGIPLWMSEVGSGGTGIQGNLTMAQHLIRDMRYMEPTVWCDWQYIEEGNDQWCLVKANFSKVTYAQANHYYVRRHISKYIGNGSTILTSTNDNTLIARNADGDAITIVVVNNQSMPTDYRIDLGMYSSVERPTEAVWSTGSSYFNELDCNVADSYLTFRMPGLSIATIVIPVIEDTSYHNDLVNNDHYMILPRNNNSTAVGATAGKVTLMPLELEADRIWTLSLDGDQAMFVNGNGVSIVGADSYAMTTGTDEGSWFTLQPLDGNYYKISLGSRSFDLEGEKSVSGTGVGLWEYGTTPAASHRQFMFHRVADRNSMTPGFNAIIDALGNGDDAVITPGMGYVAIDGVAGSNIMICALDGRIVYNAQLQGSHVSIPLPAGIYVVAHQSQTITSRLVSVK